MYNLLFRSTLGWQHLRQVARVYHVSITFYQTKRRQHTYSCSARLRGGWENRLTTIITDFELAVLKACDIVFPDVQHKGCRFHHNAAVWKNLGAHKLQSLFYQNPCFQELIYSLYSFCYVPSDRVNEYYHEVITKLVDDGEEKDDEWKDYKEKIDAFSSYYRMTWIEKRGGRVAHFKPELQNQYATVLVGGLETNNMLESLNRTWNTLSGYSLNEFAIQELFVKQDGEAWRAYLSNAVGLYMASNSG